MVTSMSFNEQFFICRIEITLPYVICDDLARSPIEALSSNDGIFYQKYF